MELELKSMTATEVGAFGCVRRSGHSSFSNVLGAFKVRYLQLVRSELVICSSELGKPFIFREGASNCFHCQALSGITNFNRCRRAYPV